MKLLVRKIVPSFLVNGKKYAMLSIIFKQEDFYTEISVQISYKKEIPKTILNYIIKNKNLFETMSFHSICHMEENEYREIEI